VAEEGLATPTAGAGLASAGLLHPSSECRDHPGGHHRSIAKVDQPPNLDFILFLIRLVSLHFEFLQTGRISHLYLWASLHR